MNDSALTIDVWSDIACPWCYIGKHRLATALADLDTGGREIQVRYHAFQLDPYAGPADGRHEVDVLALKFGSRDQAAQALTEMTKLAAAEGLVFDFDQLVPTNTLLAHRLIAHARLAGDLTIQSDVVERLFQAHFTFGQDVGDVEVLAEIAALAGLDRAAAVEAIADEATLAVVDADKNDATQLGITAVPFYVIDKKYAVGGAQPVEFFQNALTKIAQGEAP